MMYNIDEFIRFCFFISGRFQLFSEIFLTAIITKEHNYLGMAEG